MLKVRRAAPRALPDGDPGLEQLSPGERTALAGAWQGRAEAELHASKSFAYIAGALDDLGAAPELVALARRAVDDELRHAELCRRVASVFHGSALPPPPERAIEVPAAPLDPVLRKTLHVVSMSCLNETIGSAFLEHCRDHATGRLARAALRELLSDEIDHARIGWAYLASCDATLRQAVGVWMVPLLGHNLRIWRNRPHRMESPNMVKHGYPAWHDVDRVVLAAMRDLCLPGLALVGIDTAQATRWLTDSAADTH